MPSAASRPTARRPAKVEELEVVSMSSSSSGSESEGDGEDGSSSDSDALDSNAPRKKRKVSVDVEVDPEDDEPYQTSVISSIQAPSRIRRKPATPAEPLAVKAEMIDVEMETTATSVPVDLNTTFESLSVRPWLIQSLANMAIRRPTGIQKACIPEILRGRDCIGGSRTGSGKTVAFAAPILQKLAEDPSAIFAVVLTATRELALQIMEQIKAISAAQTVKAILVTGGSDMRSQAIAIAQRPHIIVATPGRLADHIRSSGEDTWGGLRRVKFLVLDEADRLLSAGGPGSMLPDIGKSSAHPVPARPSRWVLTVTQRSAWEYCHPLPTGRRCSSRRP